MLPVVTNILYPTDLSENATFACNYAVYLAKLTGAKVHILHVSEKLSSDAVIAIESYMMSSEARKNSLKDRMKRSKAVIEKKINAYWEQQTPEVRALKDRIASVEVCEGYPAETILKRIQKRQCDLVVMGAHEKGMIHTFLGSVTKSVLRRSHVPVLVVPLPADARFSPL